jgi:hypothetical protein
VTFRFRPRGGYAQKWWRVCRRGVAGWRTGINGSQGHGWAANWHSFGVRHKWRTGGMRQATGDLKAPLAHQHRAPGGKIPALLASPLPRQRLTSVHQPDPRDFATLGTYLFRLSKRSKPSSGTHWAPRDRGDLLFHVSGMVLAFPQRKIPDRRAPGLHQPGLCEACREFYCHGLPVRVGR